MTMRYQLSRRNLLRYAGLSCLSLPLYRVLLEGEAYADAVVPKSIFVYYPDGNIADQFFPNTVGSSFTFPKITSPLAPHAGDIIIPRGLVYKTNGSHEAGAAFCLTGNDQAAGRYSIDNYLGDQLGQASPQSVLRLGTGSNFESGADKGVSYLSTGAPAVIETNPQAAFYSIFGRGGATSLADVDAQNKGKRSVLDFALGEVQGLKQKLGATEAKKLDNHLQALRTLETRLSAVASATCNNQKVDMRGLVIPDNDPNYPKTYDQNAVYATVGQIMTDIMVQAFACGISRFGLMQWSHAVSSTHFNFTGGPGFDMGHHDMSHFGGDPNGDIGQRFATAQQFHMAQVAYLIQGLKNTKVGSGSLFDSTLVMATTELGDSNQHNFIDIACLIAGNANGKLKTGQALQFGSASYNQLLVTVLQAMGLPDTTFGNSTLGSGALPGLMA